MISEIQEAASGETEFNFSGDLILNMSKSTYGKIAVIRQIPTILTIQK